MKDAKDELILEQIDECAYLRQELDQERDRCEALESSNRVAMAEAYRCGYDAGQRELELKDERIAELGVWYKNACEHREELEADLKSSSEACAAAFEVCKSLQGELTSRLRLLGEQQTAHAKAVADYNILRDLLVRIRDDWREFGTVFDHDIDTALEVKDE